MSPAARGPAGRTSGNSRIFASDILPGSVYQPLPNGAGMRVAIRRTLRVGRRAGAPVEDLGVIPDERHDLTRNDLLKGNVDLINRAGKLLAAKPVRQFIATVHDSSPAQAKLAFETEGMTRLDVYLGERPIQSLDLQDGRAAIVVPRKTALKPRSKCAASTERSWSPVIARPCSATRARSHETGPFVLRVFVASWQSSDSSPSLRRYADGRRLRVCARQRHRRPVGGRRRNPAIVAVRKPDVEQRLQRQRARPDQPRAVLALGLQQELHAALVDRDSLA